MGGVELAQKTKKYRIIRGKGTPQANILTEKKPVVTEDNAQASNRRFSPYATLDAPIPKRQRTSNPTAKKGKENRLSKAIKSILDPISGTEKSSKFTKNGRPMLEKTSYATPTAPNEGRTSPHDKISPEKALRAAMLKHKFVDTIFRATHQTLLDRGMKVDFAMIHEERQRLEKEKIREKDIIEGELQAASQKHIHKEIETHKKIQLRRETSRMKLENMQQTVHIYDSLATMREFEEMVCCGSTKCGRDTYFGRW